MEKTSIPVQMAIDPLALLLPEHVYVKIIEGLNPHVPAVKAIERAATMMNAEDKAYTMSRVKQLKEYTAAFEKVLAK